MQQDDQDKELQSLRDRVLELEQKLADKAAREAATRQDLVTSARQKQEQDDFVRRFVAGLPETEKRALRDWAAQMLALRQSRETVWNKATQALSLTVSNQAALPSLKLLAREAKHRAWDRQGGGGRTAVAAGLITLLLMGPGAIALSAVGLAVGFPLWVVFGSGAYLAAAVHDACAQ